MENLQLGTNTANISPWILHKEPLACFPLQSPENKDFSLSQRKKLIFKQNVFHRLTENWVNQLSHTIKNIWNIYGCIYITVAKLSMKSQNKNYLLLLIPFLSGSYYYDVQIHNSQIFVSFPKISPRI